MLAGLMSRWTMPAAWAIASASAICSASSIARSTGRPPRGISSLSGRPLDELHDEEVDPVGVIHFVDRDDVRVIERGCGPRLLEKPVAAVAIAAGVSGNDLDGHGPSQTRVDRAVDDTHAALADEAFDFVVREGCADHGPHLLSTAARRRTRSFEKLFRRSIGQIAMAVDMDRCISSSFGIVRRAGKHGASVVPTNPGSLNPRSLPSSAPLTGAVASERQSRRGPSMMGPHPDAPGKAPPPN